MSTISGRSYGPGAGKERKKQRPNHFKRISGSLVYTDHPGSAFWTHADQIANEMVESYKHTMDSPPAGPIILKKLQVGACSGVDFAMDFQVTHENGTTSDYHAQVWVKAGSGVVVYKHLEKVISPATSKKSKEAVILFTTKAPPPTLDKTVFDGVDEDSIELVFGRKYCKLRTVGFYIFLKEVRQRLLDDTIEIEGYDVVKATASWEWKRLCEEDVLYFMEKAALKLKEKWLKNKEKK